MERYPIEAIDSVSKISKLGFTGIDISIEESLFEYGMVWKECEDGELLFIHANPNQFKCVSDEELEFDTTYMNESDISLSLLNKSKFYSFMGISKSEWSKYPLGTRISDLSSYYGFEDVFGSSYGGFKIKKQ